VVVWLLRRKLLCAGHRRANRQHPA
jgi:hypothetical protein